MLEPRLYRASLLLPLAALVVVMFSVVSRPEPLRSTTASDAFEGDRAAGLARRLVELAPDRSPGSRGDAAAAEFVAQRFRSVTGGQVAQESFDGNFDGDDVEMRNVSLILPGRSNRRVVLVADRDCPAGPCAVSSAAATGALLELASNFGGTRHSKTFVFVSADGSAAGAAGARELGSELEAQPADAVIVISQPGAAALGRPFVVPWSAGDQSTSIQLQESAEAAVESEAGSDPLSLGTFSSLFRLAVPSGLGDQGVLIERGVDAIAISSAGARPVPPSRDRLGSLSPDTLGNFGRATLSLSLALDAAGDPLEHGPDTYIPLAGKLMPGWALALLAGALLVPVGVVSLDGLARASRGGAPVLRTLAWVLGRAIPFLAALVLAYLMAAVGVLSKPDFPFDPQRHPFGFGPALALLVLVAAFAAAIYASRHLGAPSEAEDALPAAVGMIGFAAVAATWLINPYLALLVVPSVHLWLLGTLPELRAAVLPSLVAGALGLILPLIAVAALGSSLGVGWEAPWQLLMMFTGRHFGPLAAVPLCVLGGCLVAMVELAMRYREPPASGMREGPARLGTHAGPGALGGPPSSLTRR